MNNDGIEKLPGETFEEEKRGEYADVWEDANMDETAPEFQGDDPYNPKIVETEEETGETEGVAKTEKAEKYGGAGRLADYGLDTAARIYGIDSVLKQINETDETDRDAINPIGSIYERLVPNPEERSNLYREIGKDEDEEQRMAMKDTPEQVNNAIHQMKVILNALENDSRFASVRERAAENGKDVISYLTSDEVNPTLSNFFEGLDAASGGSVEEILDEIEKEEQVKEIKEEAEEFERINPEMLQ